MRLIMQEYMYIVFRSPLTRVNGCVKGWAGEVVTPVSHSVLTLCIMQHIENEERKTHDTKTKQLLKGSVQAGAKQP